MPAELAGEWIDKAEEDWLGVRRLAVGDLGPVADVAAFLSQQCAEKYLKALLQESDIEPPRLHHLPALLDLLLAVHPDLEPIRVACERLSPFAVAFRYPGQRATREEAREAIALADQVRSRIRTLLGLPSDLLTP